MYKIAKINNDPMGTIRRLVDGASIPFDSGNSDYKEFKRQIIEEEVELQDVDGNVMTTQQAKDFIATLPA